MHAKKILTALTLTATAAALTACNDQHGHTGHRREGLDRDKRSTHLL